jgi:sirohydrochlorin cobaltochelatase
MIVKGLLELESIRGIWMNHTKEAETLEDYYHSMFPEE